MPHLAARKAVAGDLAENAKLLDFEPRFQSPQGPAQMHRRRARSSRVDRLGIARPAQSVTQMGAGRSSDLRARIACLLTDPIPHRLDRQWRGMRLPSGARSQRRGRTGFAPDSLFAGPGRLPSRPPAPRDKPDHKARQSTMSRSRTGKLPGCRRPDRLYGTPTSLYRKCPDRLFSDFVNSPGATLAPEQACPRSRRIQPAGPARLRGRESGTRK